jgi:hypothetical protein
MLDPTIPPPMMATSAVRMMHIVAVTRSAGVPPAVEGASRPLPTPEETAASQRQTERAPYGEALWLVTGYYRHLEPRRLSP